MSERPRAWWLRRLALAALVTAGAALLPFVVLVRCSMHAERAWSWPAWPSVAFGAAAATAVLFVYWSLLSRRPRAGAAAACGAAVLVYCSAALLPPPPARLKDEKARAGYASVHPALRLATGMTALADEDLVVTDTRRARTDYARMGLPARPRSLHYKGSDGWVRAVDLRTTDRGLLRNLTVHLWVRALGLQALRHGGTADHLHVGLPLP